MQKVRNRLNLFHPRITRNAVLDIPDRRHRKSGRIGQRPKVRSLHSLKGFQNLLVKFHARNLPNPEHEVKQNLTDTDCPHSYDQGMCGSLDSKEVLWRNVSLAMREKYGRENLHRLAKEAGIGIATVQRIKAAQTSVGIEILDKLAIVFAVEPWHLLVATFDPKNPPVVYLSSAERDFYERMKDAARKLINNK